MEKNIKILVVYQWISFFPKVPVYIQRDIDILNDIFEVKPFFFRINRIFSLILEIKRSDVIFIWFADSHALITTLLARIIKKPIIIVIGGYDVAAEKKINYGLMQFSISRHMVKFILKRASRILAVSECNKKECEKYLGINTAEIVYNCVDTNYFTPFGKKENFVITVGLVSKITIKRKGLDIYVKVAEKLPNITFYLIGSWEKGAIKYLKSIAPPNVVFTGFISEEELLRFYQRAKVYCQLSLHEAFGVSVAEAMSCECIPIISDRGALSEVVGNTGFCVEYGEVDEIVKAIKKALVDNINGANARKRVVEKFSLKTRREKIYKIIKEMIP